MESTKEREIYLEANLQRLEERRNTMEEMRIESDRIEEEEWDNIREMERSLEQMQECCLSSDYEILQPLEEKRSLIRELKSRKEEFREEYYHELKKEYNRLDLEREETENEKKQLYDSEEDC